MSKSKLSAVVVYTEGGHSFPFQFQDEDVAKQVSDLVIDSVNLGHIKDDPACKIVWVEDVMFKISSIVAVKDFE